MTSLLAEAPARARSTAQRPNGPVVLYIEDHPVNVLVMEALLLHRPKLRLVVATTGEEGLQAARVERPDLLLLDYHLPDCNGSDLLAELRRLDGLADTPAVVVSATDASGATGPDGFLEFWPKPLDVRGTLHAIDRLIDDHTHVGADRTLTIAGSIQ
ncbi:response regulator [Rhizobacter sp. LjRoot28]|uniref:response regulator n=1 Tax=Rhizobacter sp. LjRoot28 TaxID=3342309 RepID=UPI003ECD1AFF